MQSIRRRLADRGERDEGISLIELIVALGIFSTVVAIFMAGVVVMTRNTVRSQVVSDSGDALRVTFQRLDKQVRYADAINFEGAGAGGAQYVEFRTPATVAPSGVTTCTQWRWDPATKVLQYRMWAQSDATLPSFTTIAKNVVAGTAPYPFDMVPASPTHPRQSLKVTLVASVDDRTVTTASEFVARNSSVESAGNADTNGDGISDVPACWRSGVRP